MSTQIFNLSTTSPPLPGPRFMWSRDEKGLCTGRHTFTLVKGAMELPVQQARFKKGTPITDLDPSIGAILSFLTVETFDVDTIAGGYEEVTVSIKGYSESGDFEFDREVSYHSNNTLTEKSILENPKYLAEVTSHDTRDCFSKVYNGHAIAKTTFSGGELSSIFFYDTLGNSLMAITDEASLKWYRLIFIEDNRTFMAPTFEWVKSTTNAGGLSDAELAKLGKIDDPPGGPPSPPNSEGYAWLKSGANDARGESSANTEETWSWGKYPEDIYGA